MKHNLIIIIGMQHFTYEYFHTILKRIEFIFNSRPICPLSNDSNDFATITPGQFLIGTKQNSLSEENVIGVSANRLDKFY